MSNVTAPFIANALPTIVAEVFIVILVKATMVPWNITDVSSVAEEPTCQKTLAAVRPPVSKIRELGVFSPRP